MAAFSPALTTALTPGIGYEAAAHIALRALAKDRPIIELATEETDLSSEELHRLLDPFPCVPSRREGTNEEIAGLLSLSGL